MRYFKPTYDKSSGIKGETYRRRNKIHKFIDPNLQYLRASIVVHTRESRDINQLTARQVPVLRIERNVASV